MIDLEAISTDMKAWPIVVSRCLIFGKIHRKTTVQSVSMRHDAQEVDVETGIGVVDTGAHS